MQAIRGQSYPVSEILVLENGEETVPELYSNDSGIVRIRSSKNLGVWARFTVGLNATSDFIWLIDDDVVPGSRWLENAITTFLKQPSVIGSRGLRFRTEQSYLLYDEFGPNNPSDVPTMVDIVGHNWIFPRSWLGAFWATYSEKFNSERAGEDIHLSYSVQKIFGFPSVVPPHPIEDRELWGEIVERSKFDGHDSVGISHDLSSLNKFEAAYRHYVKLGFRIFALSGDDTYVQLPRHRVVGKIVARFPRLAIRVATLLGLRKKSI
jgi:glycosyltransferase involved in cell wall biosynthesis